MGWILLVVKGLIVVIAIIIILVLYGAYDYFVKTSKVIKEAKKFVSQADAMIRDGYSEKKLDKHIELHGNFDVIVIGSGIGGLATAALLSRRNKKVLVLEQHDVIGGNTHSFTEKGYEFDTGIHYIGGEVGEKHSLLGILFNMLTLGYLKWSKINGPYDVARISPCLNSQESTITTKAAEDKLDKNTILDSKHDENELRISSQDSLRSHLERMYPSEISSIASYFRLINWGGQLVFPLYLITQTLPNYLSSILSFFCSPLFKIYFGSTSYEVIRGLTKNKDLIGQLTWNYGDVGVPPGLSCFMMTSLLTTHYANGAYYPTGGTVEIARGMVSTILGAGGKLFTRAEVSNILLDDSGSKAVGVVVRGKSIYSPIVVSATGALSTFTRLVSSTVSTPYLDHIRSTLSPHHRSLPSTPSSTSSSSVSLQDSSSSSSVYPSCCMFSVFIGLDLPSTSNLDIPAYNTWLFPSWDHDSNYKEYMSSSSDVLGSSLPLMFVSFSSGKDASWSSRFPGKAVVELLTVTDFDSFATIDKRNSKKDGNYSTPGARGDKYNKLKEEMSNRMVNVFRKEFPSLSPHIDYVLGASPLTNNYYLGSIFGEIYGLEHSVARYTKGRRFLKPRQEISNLYLSGQDAMCNGLAGAFVGGISCAVCVDPTVITDIATSLCFRYNKENMKILLFKQLLVL